MSLERYDEGIAKARANFTQTPTVQWFLDASTTQRQLEAALIQFSALGVQMTGPVEGWIRRAGERCVECGYATLGHALVRHAVEEANHDEMMRADARALVAAWNQTYADTLDVDTLLASGPTPGIEAYVRLHEDVIASDQPYRQISIEYEIEALSVRVGPVLLGRCARGLGPEVLQRLSFARFHVQADVAHSAFDREQLGTFVDQHPEALEPLVRAGEQALEAYAGFLDGCRMRALELLGATA